MNISNINYFNGTFFQLMREIYELINLSENNPLAKNAILFYSPIHFKRRFTNKYVLFSDRQHDSIEFIRFF